MSPTCTWSCTSAGDKAAARSELEKILATNKPFPQQEEAKALLGKL